MNRKTYGPARVFGVVALLLLAGCSTSDRDEPTASASSTTPSAESTESVRPSVEDIEAWMRVRQAVHGLTFTDEEYACYSGVYYDSPLTDEGLIALLDNATLPEADQRWIDDERDAAWAHCKAAPAPWSEGGTLRADWVGELDIPLAVPVPEYGFVALTMDLTFGTQSAFSFTALDAEGNEVGTWLEIPLGSDRGNVKGTYFAGGDAAEVTAVRVRVEGEPMTWSATLGLSPATIPTLTRGVQGSGNQVFMFENLGGDYTISGQGANPATSIFVGEVRFPWDTLVGPQTPLAGSDGAVTPFVIDPTAYYLVIEANGDWVIN